MQSMDENRGALMRREIAEQAESWRRLAVGDSFDAAVGLILRRAPRTIVFVARGTSDHAATYGQYLFQSRLGLAAYLATPSVVTAFGRNVFAPDSLVIALSQSGGSPDIVATAVAAKAVGVPVIAVTNTPGSPLAAAANVHVDLAAGPERSVAATKSYTAELIALHRIVEGVRNGGAVPTSAAVDVLAGAFERSFAGFERFAQELAARIVGADRALLVGRGLSYASVKEGALKLTETSGTAASGWSAADVRHGPIGQVAVGTPVVLFAASPAGRESVVELVPVLAERGATSVLVERAGDAPIDGVIVARAVVAAEVPEDLIPVLEIVPVQLLALELSLARGLDPDRPTGLSKVTRTL